MAPPASSAVRRGAAATRTGGKAGRSGRADRSGKATKSDVAGLRRQAAASDDMSRQAYEAGVDGTPFDEGLFADVPGARDAYDTGAAERRRSSRSATADRARGAAQGVAGVRGPGWVNDGAGFVLGLLVYALVLNYLQGGAAQARGWIAAKFLNRPYTGGPG